MRSKMKNTDGKVQCWRNWVKENVRGSKSRKEGRKEISPKREEMETWITDWLTDSMDQCPSWEANSHPASLWILHFYGTPMVHYSVHKGPPLVPVLSQRIRPNLRRCVTFLNKPAFYSALLAPRPNPKLEDYPLSRVRISSEDVPCRGDRQGTAWHKE
jgi:hypothetical protein